MKNRRIMVLNIYHALSLAIIILSFMLLSQVLKDQRIKSKFPKVDSLAIKLILCAAFISQLGLLVDFNSIRQAVYMLTFKGCVCIGLGIVYMRYLNSYVKIPIQVMGEEQILKFRSDRYVEISKGVWVRYYPGDGVAITPNENELIKMADERGSGWISLFFRIVRSDTKEEEYQYHYHLTAEETYIQDGLADILDNTPPVSKGETIHVPAEKLHRFKSLTAECLGATFIQRA